MPSISSLALAGRYAELLDIAEGRAATEADPSQQHLDRAEAAWELGLLPLAHAEALAARNLLMKLGDRRRLAVAYAWVSRTELAMGASADAAAPLEKARQGIETSGTPADRALLAALRLEEAHATGAPSDGGALDELVKAARDSEDPWWLAWSAWAEAEASVAAGDRSTARPVVERFRKNVGDAVTDLAWRSTVLLAATATDGSTATDALAALATLESALPPKVRDAFLRRPDRLRCERWLDRAAGGDRARRDLRSLSRVIRAMNAEPRVEPLLRLVIDSMIDTTGAEVGLLVLLELEGVQCSVRRAAGGRDLPADESPLSLNVARRVAESGRTICLGDAAVDPEWMGVKSIAEKGLRSVLCVPLRFRERSMGSVFLSSRASAGAFERADVELAEVLADQAAIALENALLHVQSIRDPLTSVSTHAHLESRLAQEVNRAKRQGTKCSLLMVDLDRFKMVNDTFGHDAGSRLLQRVAEVLRSQVRTYDVAGRVDPASAMVGRFGGDEFEILLPDTPREGSRIVAERILAAFHATPFECNGTRLEITTSLGGATFPDDAADAQALFLRADEALYAAKRSGRDRYVAHEPSPPREPAEQEIDVLLLSKYGREVVSLVSRVLEPGENLQVALDRALSATVRVTSAERGFIVLLSGKDHVEVRSAFNIPKEELSPERFRISYGVVTRIVTEGKPLRVNNVATDEALATHQSLQALGLHSLLAAPIPGDAGPIGLLYLDSTSRKKQFTSEDEALLVHFAGFLGRALKLAVTAHERSARLDTLERALAAGLKDLQAQYRFDALIGDSPALRSLRVMLDHIVRFPYPVLVVGETGTGKEVVAKAIHANSPRKDAPLVSVNCAALPKDLLESELFGHVKGAFSGADRDRPGLFRAAHQGTLFLDEIGETPEDLQRKLLRVLQEGEFVPVGSTVPQRCDVRIVAATNRDLEEDVRAGRFREDLYYRLKVYRVQVPPLRERPGDVPLLARHFLDKVSAEADLSRRELATEAIQVLERYAWPGNVRELENAIRYAVAFSGEVVRPEHLPPEVRKGPAMAASRQVLDQMALDGDLKPVDALWKGLILRVLEETQWNQSATAKEIGISRETLRRKMKAYGIRPPVES